MYNFRNNYVYMTISSSIWSHIWENLNQTIQSPIENLTIEEFQIINTTTCLAHHLDIILINENYKFLPNINIDKLINKMLNYVLNHVNYSTMETFLSSCGNLVCLKECSSFLVNNVHTLLGILSLPWMSISNGVFKILTTYNILNIIMNKYSTILSKLIYVIL